MTLPAKLIIAIDGYSSCGKSTFAKAIAKKLGYTYIDTGAMYRAITLLALQNNILSEEKIDQNRLKDLIQNVNICFKTSADTGNADTYLNGMNVEEEIRSMYVSKYVSQVSRLKFVREKMVHIQRKMGEERGVVVDGRDIGTVVFPYADIKIFMTAKADIRARRRYDELKAKGIEVSIEEIKDNIIKRDIQDTSRAESPLIKAKDAIELDNSYMTTDEQMEWFLNLLNSKGLLNSMII